MAKVAVAGIDQHQLEAQCCRYLRVPWEVDRSCLPHGHIAGCFVPVLPEVACWGQLQHLLQARCCMYSLVPREVAHSCHLHGRIAGYPASEWAGAACWSPNRHPWSAPRIHIGSAAPRSVAAIHWILRWIDRPTRSSKVALEESATNCLIRFRKPWTLLRGRGHSCPNCWMERTLARCRCCCPMVLTPFRKARSHWNHRTANSQHRTDCADRGCWATSRSSRCWIPVVLGQDRGRIGSWGLVGAWVAGEPCAEKPALNRSALVEHPDKWAQRDGNCVAH